MSDETTRVDPTEQAVAERVHFERERHGWSQTRLAEAMTNRGVVLTQSGVSKIERGDRAVSIPELVAFTAVFELTTEQMLAPPPNSAFREIVDSATSASAAATTLPTQQIRDIGKLLRRVDVLTARRSNVDTLDLIGTHLDAVNQALDRLTTSVQSTRVTLDKVQRRRHQRGKH